MSDQTNNNENTQSDQEVREERDINFEVGSLRYKEFRSLMGNTSVLQNAAIFAVVAATMAKTFRDMEDNELNQMSAVAADGLKNLVDGFYSVTEWMDKEDAKADFEQVNSIYTYTIDGYVTNTPNYLYDIIFLQACLGYLSSRFENYWSTQLEESPSEVATKALSHAKQCVSNVALLKKLRLES